MDVSVAQHLRTIWKPGKPCAHPGLAPETSWGRETGRVVCTTCGESFTRAAATSIGFRPE